MVRTGDRLRRQGRFSEAEEAYRAALRADAHEARAHVGLQTLAERQGRHLELRRRYRDGGDPFLVARLEPVSKEQRETYRQAAEPWRSFGLATSQAGHGGSAPRARYHYVRALTVDPGHTWARLGRARVWLAQGDVGAAEADFSAAMWGEPEHPLPWLGLSAIADRRGDLREAFRWAVEAYRRAPADEALAGRVHALAVRGGSKAYLRRAAEELEEQGVHDEGVGLLYASTLWARLGQRERARATREAAVHERGARALPTLPRDRRGGELRRVPDVGARPLRADDGARAGTRGRAAAVRVRGDARRSHGRGQGAARSSASRSASAGDTSPATRSGAGVGTWPVSRWPAPSLSICTRWRAGGATCTAVCGGSSRTGRRCLQSPRWRTSR
jgi:hypothetical protein